MLPLDDAVISYAMSTLAHPIALPLCRVNLGIVRAADRFVLATFVRTWREWMQTPVAAKMVN